MPRIARIVAVGYPHRIVPIFLAILVVIPACSRTTVVKESRSLMGTVVELTVHHRSYDNAKKMVDAAFSEGERIENLFSIYRDSSEVSTVNRKAAFEEVELTQDVYFVTERALYYSELTHGAFDISVGPLVELWGFSRREKESSAGSSGEEKSIPGKAQIDEVLPLVGYRNILLNKEKNTIRFATAGMKLDFGGIAKGYAVDKMVCVLKDGGVKAAIVNVGGNLYALGAPGRKKYWSVGIKHPRKPGIMNDLLRIRDRAIATSGDYERFFIHDGRRYSHIIDPRTGYPASPIGSVTVIAKTAMDADALGTGFFVLGEEESKKIASRLEGIEVIFSLMIPTYN